MKKKPLISIITPSFNQGRFLEAAIKSVISQDYQKIEYIVIDGGSQDNSIDIIKKYQQKIAYWSSCPDNGQANAINKGFEHVSGDIMCWLNADDMYLPGTFSKIAEKFSSEPEIGLAYGDCVYIDEQGNFVRYFDECEDFNSHRLRNFSDFISQPTTFFSSKQFKNIGGLNESLHYALDWDLWCRLEKAGAKFKYIKRVLAANREHASTKTNCGGSKRLDEIWRVHKMHKDCIWPNAFFGFLAGEVVNLGKIKENRINRYLLSCLGRTISMLSPRAKWYRLTSGIFKKTLYGFYPGNTKTDGSAIILLPLYNDNDFSSISGCVGLEKKTAEKNEKVYVKIQLEKTIAIEFPLSSKCLNKNFKISIPEQSRQKNRIKLEINFKKKNRPVNGHIYNVKFEN